MIQNSTCLHPEIEDKIKDWIKKTEEDPKDSIKKKKASETKKTPNE